MATGNGQLLLLFHELPETCILYRFRASIQHYDTYIHTNTYTTHTHTQTRTNTHTYSHKHTHKHTHTEKTQTHKHTHTYTFPRRFHESFNFNLISHLLSLFPIIKMCKHKISTFMFLKF